MLVPLLQGALFSTISWFLWRILRPYVVKSSLDAIPGPPFGSFLLGNLPELYARDGWTFLDTLDEQYGPIVRIQGMFGKPALYVFDPKALHHIVLKDQNVYERSSVFVAINRLLFGNSLLSTHGDHHRKQRKLLNPVFSIGHMRSITPVFYQTAHRLREAISGQLKTQDHSEVDMLNWFGRTALELIGQGGLGYSFDPLVATAQNTYGESLKALLPTLGRCLNWRMLAPHYAKFGPAALRRLLVNLIPNQAVQDLKAVVDTMDSSSKEIFEGKRAALEAGDEAVKQQIGEGKDIMSILLRANMETLGEDKLSKEELIAQMSTLIFAATDTTSNALARTLELLAKHPEVQDKLRAEIMEASQGQDIPYDRLVDLPYLDAVCRETLRLYPPGSFTNRETRRDIVLPFSQPVKAVDGTVLHEVVVPKGTLVVVGIRSCNRNTAIWGEDASEWKPERCLTSVPSAVKNAGIPGVYSNLMTFLGGGNSCIGFKFSQLEMKVILAVFLASFRVCPSDKDICWNMGDVTYPTVGPDSVKPSMPIRIEVI